MEGWYVYYNKTIKSNEMRLRNQVLAIAVKTCFSQLLRLTVRNGGSTIRVIREPVVKCFFRCNAQNKNKQQQY